MLSSASPTHRPTTGNFRSSYTTNPATVARRDRPNSRAGIAKPATDQPPRWGSGVEYPPRLRPATALRLVRREASQARGRAGYRERGLFRFLPLVTQLTQLTQTPHQFRRHLLSPAKVGLCQLSQLCHGGAKVNCDSAGTNSCWLPQRRIDLVGRPRAPWAGFARGLHQPVGFDQFAGSGMDRGGIPQPREPDFAL